MSECHCRKSSRAASLPAKSSCDKGPQVVDGGLVGQADAAGSAGLDGHVAQRHARLHAHGLDHGAAKFDDPVGGAVDAELSDDEEDDVLGVNPRRQFTVQVDPDGCRLPESTDPLEDADLEIGGAHAGGKGPEGAVGTGVGVAHDHGKSGPDVPFFGENGMADAVVADIEKVGNFVTPSPVPQHFGLQGGLAVFGGGDVIDHRLDLGGIENPVLVPPHQVGNGDGGGDLVTQHPVKIEDLGPRERLVPQMGVENFLCDGLSHGLSSTSRIK